jgi:trimeric autotransporter adhesin
VLFSFTTLMAGIAGQAFEAKFNDTAIVPGPIVAPTNICVGTNATLSDYMSEGYWAVSNTAVATIDPYAGILTGVAAGTDTIYYTIHGYTVVATIAVDSPMNPGIITGPTAMCMYSSITLSDTIGPGRWFTTGVYTTVDGAGVVTGLNAGIDTVKFIDSNVCGIATAVMPVTINSSPVVPPISGATTVCQSSTTTLSDLTPGGSWTASNAHATINILGVVTGASAGVDTIWYRKTNGVCTTTVSQVMTVIPHPVAGIISGVSSLCVGVTDTFTDTVTGGTWGSLTPSKLHVDTTGVATGLAGGIGIIGYTVYNTCGAATATRTVTVLPLSDPGTITGPGRVCAGAVITLADTTTGGTWSVTNSNATDSMGIVSGIAAGTDTVMYTTTNSCGPQSAIKLITIDPLPVVTPILGASGICLGDSTMLADSTTGGVWSVSNSLLTVAGGMVVSPGVNVGVDTVSYTVTNSCGSVSAVRIVHIDTIPVAGVIAGPDSLCAGSSVVYSDSVAHGSWSVTDPYLCFVTDSLITGIFGGLDTLVYTVTNGCASVWTTKSVYVISIPVGGFVAGPDTVCVSGSIELYPSNPGGNWAVTNGLATDTGAFVYGVAPGFDTVVYSVTNGCGTDTTYKVLYVKPLPTVAPLTGTLRMCIYASVTLADTSYPGYWTETNGNTTVLDGVVTGTHAGTDTVIYNHTDLCGVASAQAVVTIDPLPDPGVITGADTVCQGDSVLLSDAVTGGVWSSQLTFLATVAGGMVHAVLPGVDSIYYSFTNACGTARAVYGIDIVTPVLPIAGGGHLACVGGIKDSIWAYPDGGVWTSTGSGATLTSFAGGVAVTGVAPGMDTIIYALTGHCGTFRDTVTVSVGQMVQTVVSGPSSLCVGKTDTLAATPAGGYWMAGTTNISLTGISSGLVVTGDTAGNAVVYYSMINPCGAGTDSVVLTVFSKAYCDSANEVRGPVAGGGDFGMYPNPTTGELLIHTGTDQGTRMVAVWDMTGRKAYCLTIASGSDELRIDLPGNAPGTYIVEISDGAHTERSPVVLTGR